MGGKKNKRRRALHIGVLILGAYLLFLGGGTMAAELGAIVILGERSGIVIARAVMGAAFTVLGVLAVWDSIRDLWPRKTEAEAAPLQFIFTDTAGNRSSSVTPELIREQIGLISEKLWHISLQPAEPLPAAPGALARLDYALMEEGMFLVAVLGQEDGGVQVRRRRAAADEAETAMAALLEGKPPDLSGWESLQAVPRQPEFQMKRRLVLVKATGTSDHEFFSERDLDLAVTGLADGTYQRFFVQAGPLAMEALPRENGDVCLRLLIRQADGIRAWQRCGMPNQARFWLLQFYDGSLLQSPMEGWEPTEP